MISKEYARERLSPTSSTGFTSTNLPPTDRPQVLYVRIQSINGLIFYRTDGSAATNATGFKLPENSVVEIHGAEALNNFRCIDNADSAELECKYMGAGG